MKTNLYILALVASLTFNCEGQTPKPSLDKEIEKWKKELVLTHQLGGPCEDDYQKWKEKYPNLNNGISEDLTITKKDFNDDGMVDAVVVMHLGDPCNGGNAIETNPVVYIFSHEGEYYKDVRLSDRIEQLIKIQLMDAPFELQKVMSGFTVSGDNLVGNVTIWADEDANCCPSYSGNYTYDLLTTDLALEYKKDSKD
ncbi:MAG: hypothetical protein R2797_04710 [Gelidibacter sp.]